MPKILLTQSCFQNKCFTCHTHDGYSISLIQEGTHHFVIEGERMQADIGKVRIIHPYEEHETLSSSWRHINLSLESSYIEERALSLQIEPPVIFSHLITDNILNDMLLHLYSIYTKEERHTIKELSDTLIHYLLKQHRLAYTALPTFTDTTQLEKARSYIHAYAHDASLNLDDVARKAQMSKYHFLRLFKQNFGRTPHQYLQNIRIDCVRKTIAQGRSLSQAAHDCGFYDQSHMIRIYKKFYGHTPGAILRKKEQ